MSSEGFDTLTKRLSSFKLDDALVYLNFVLQSSQDPELDPAIYQFVENNPSAVTDFKVEFLAKWFIIKSSSLSPYKLDWPSYLELSALYNRIDDPIVGDPTFQRRNPVEVFVRLLHQQIPGQERIPLQSFGSAYLLFQEAGARMASAVGYSMPERFRELAGLSIEQFMRLGFTFSGARTGPFRTHGTVDGEWLRKGQQQGIDILTDANIAHFLALTSCSYEEFRAMAAQDLYTVADPVYVLYEFNPLKKRPLVQVHPNRWVAPNPYLIIDRVTLGIYYDLLDADGIEFTTAFGLVFQEYVGDLLKSVYPASNVIAEKVYGQPERRGPADWVVVEGRNAVFFECKSFIPNLSFFSIAGQTDIEQYANRIASAIAQTCQHIATIQAGETDLQEFAGLDAKVVVLTFGRVQAVNTVFFKPEIDRLLVGMGITNPSYVVLSLQELEHLLSLVERGVSLTELLTRLEDENQRKALEPYSDMLSQCALPSLVAQKGKEVVEFSP